MKVIKIVGSS